MDVDRKQLLNALKRVRSLHSGSIHARRVALSCADGRLTTEAIGATGICGRISLAIAGEPLEGPISVPHSQLLGLVQSLKGESIAISIHEGALSIARPKLRVILRTEPATIRAETIAKRFGLAEGFADASGKVIGSLVKPVTVLIASAGDRLWVESHTETTQAYASCRYAGRRVNCTVTADHLRRALRLLGADAELSVSSDSLMLTTDNAEVVIPLVAGSITSQRKRTEKRLKTSQAWALSDDIPKLKIKSKPTLSLVPHRRATLASVEANGQLTTVELQGTCPTVVCDYTSLMRAIANCDHTNLSSDDSGILVQEDGYLSVINFTPSSTKGTAAMSAPMPRTAENASGFQTRHGVEPCSTHQ